MRWASGLEKLQSHGHLLRETLGQRLQQLVIFRLAGAQDRPLHVARLHPALHHVDHQVEALLVDQPADESHQRRVRLLRQSQFLLQARPCRSACPARPSPRL